MPNVDQFESVFQSAVKAVYHYVAPTIRRPVLITDLPQEKATALTAQVRDFLRVLQPTPDWRTIAGDQVQTVPQMLEAVATHQPDLICTYRNLHSTTGAWSHSLGRHLDVLTQKVGCPVLVIPHPSQADALSKTLHDTNRVMAMTDHLAGADQLVHYAAALTQPQGVLQLSHIEDDAVFDRYIAVIARIPEIDTDMARKRLKQQLLKEPADYIASCRRELRQKRSAITIEPIVMMGHRLKTYQALIEQHRVDLLVLNTKDEDQLAMHGMAYPLAVELRDTPLLLL